MIVALVATLFSGCYHYVPVGPEAPERGDPVRAHMSGGTVELGDIAVHDVATVYGEFIVATDDRLSLSAMWIENASARQFEGLGYTVTLERRLLQELSEKRLDPLRTALFGTGITTGVILLHMLAQSLGDETGQPPGSGGDEK